MRADPQRTLAILVNAGGNRVGQSLPGGKRGEPVEPDLIHTWDVVPDPDAAFTVAEEDIKRLKYSSCTLTDNDMVVKALLRSEIDLDDLFSPGQLLAISSTQGKLMTIGTYLRQEDSSIVIAKLSEVNSRRIAKSGEITIDGKQWVTSWNRQR
jgi:hypothetical protein